MRMRVCIKFVCVCTTITGKRVGRKEGQREGRKEKRIDKL